VNEDDVYLDARAVFLIEYLRQPRKTQRFYNQSRGQNRARAFGKQLAGALYV
jgi:hypothetical protein